MDSRDPHVVTLPIVEVLVLGRRHVANGATEPTVASPLDPLGGGQLDLLERAPRPAAANELGLAEAVHARLLPAILARSAPVQVRRKSWGTGAGLPALRPRFLQIFQAAGATQGCSCPESGIKRPFLSTALGEGRRLGTADLFAKSHRPLDSSATLAPLNWANC